MAEFRVKVWRRTQRRLRPLVVKPEDIETDEVSVEASSAESAMRQVLGAEYAENTDKLFRALVRVDSDVASDVSGLGDYGLMRYLDGIETQKLLDEHNQ